MASLGVDPESVCPRTCRLANLTQEVETTVTNRSVESALQTGQMRKMKLRSQRRFFVPLRLVIVIFARVVDYALNTHVKDDRQIQSEFWLDSQNAFDF